MTLPRVMNNDTVRALSQLSPRRLPAVYTAKVTTPKAAPMSTGSRRRRRASSATAGAPMGVWESARADTRAIVGRTPRK